jgi:hypothetical protein
MTGEMINVGAAAQQKLKSFWEKPEGTTGMLFGVGIFAAIGIILWNYSGKILLMLQNTIGIAICIAVLSGLIYIAVDPKFRTLLFYMYKGVMKKITSAFVNIDPISVIESYVDTLKENMVKMERQITNLKQAITRLKREIDSNDQGMQNSLKTADAAKKQNAKAQMIISARKAGRLKDSNMSLSALLKKLEVLYSVLNKMEEASGFMLEDIQDEVNVKKKEYEAIKIGSSAFRSAMSIIKGDPDKKEMFDMAMEGMATDVGNRIGEMERFMEISESVITGIDLQKGVYEEEGLAMLQEWEDKGVSLLLGDGKTSFVQDVYNSPDVKFGEKVAVTTPRSKYFS